jgi:hypothetical protein
MCKVGIHSLIQQRRMLVILDSNEGSNWGDCNIDFVAQKNVAIYTIFMF